MLELKTHGEHNFSCPAVLSSEFQCAILAPRPAAAHWSILGMLDSLMESEVVETDSRSNCYSLVNGDC